jgi:hypothetical protein
LLESESLHVDVWEFHFGGVPVLQKKV